MCTRAKREEIYIAIPSERSAGSPMSDTLRCHWFARILSGCGPGRPLGNVRLRIELEWPEGKVYLQIRLVADRDGRMEMFVYESNWNSRKEMSVHDSDWLRTGTAAKKCSFTNRTGMARRKSLFTNQTSCGPGRPLGNVRLRIELE